MEHGLGEPMCETSMSEDVTREGLVVMENIFELSDRSCETINVTVQQYYFQSFTAF